MNIEKIARLLKVSSHSIRYWRHLGLLSDRKIDVLRLRNDPSKELFREKKGKEQSSQYSSASNDLTVNKSRSKAEALLDFEDVLKIRFIAMCRRHGLSLQKIKNIVSIPLSTEEFQIKKELRKEKIRVDTLKSYEEPYLPNLEKKDHENNPLLRKELGYKKTLSSPTPSKKKIDFISTTWYKDFILYRSQYLLKREGDELYEPLSGQFFFDLAQDQNSSSTSTKKSRDAVIVAEKKLKKKQLTRQKLLREKNSLART